MLLQHSLREEWGLGIVVSQASDRVQLQFQDGLPRSFKKGYYHLFEAIDRRLDVTLGIVDALHGMMDGPKRTSKRNRAVTLDEQVAYFSEQYEGGFEGAQWDQAHRGSERKTPLKRHRDGLVAMAKQEFGKTRLRKALNAGTPGEVHAAAVCVVASTNIVKVKERKLFDAMSPSQHALFANSLFSLLHGRASFGKRFDDLVASLERGMGQAPSWELSTIFLAAYRPEDHTVVRLNTQSRQAEYMAPGMVLSGRPMGIFYERLLKMSVTVREALESEGCTPRDHFDVFDFMWQTLRPAAQKVIRASAAHESAADRDALAA